MTHADEFAVAISTLQHSKQVDACLPQSCSVNEQQNERTLHDASRYDQPLQNCV